MLGESSISVPTSAWSKSEEIGRALKGLVKRAGPEGKLPTVRELCQRLRVSRATLNRAMEELERQGVLRREHGRGIFAAAAKATRTVGVLFGLDPFRVSASPFYQLLFDALRRELAGRAYELEMYVDLAYAKDHWAVRRRLQADIAEGRVDGLLLPISGREQSEWVGRQGAPFVSCNPLASGWRVGLDIRRAIDLLVEALARRGCRRIALMSHPLTSRTGETIGAAERRYFDEALAKHGLRGEPGLIFQPTLHEEEFPNPTGPTHEEIGFMLGRKLAESPGELPEGLLVLDDMMARGALTALARARVGIGRQIQVATHTACGSSALIGYEQRVIRVEEDLRAIAQAMIGMLETLMDGGRPESEVLLVGPGELRMMNDE